MKTKKICIILIVLAVLALAVLLFVHFAPIWASVTTLCGVAAGLILGWIGRILYVKYVK